MHLSANGLENPSDQQSVVAVLESFSEEALGWVELGAMNLARKIANIGLKASVDGPAGTC
ncbi:MAG: purine nucleoside permease [Verrucomicrobiales bacterium]|jgi:purine nucleoside permease